MKKVEKELNEFKKFILRGNVLDLAVGVIIGGAFSTIVSSLVNDILMPIVGICLGGVDFKNLSLKLGDATIAYGNFIQNVIDFLIISACIFVIIKVINKLLNPVTKKKEEPKKEEPKKPDDVLLLEEIRDLLKKQAKSNKNK